MPGSARFCPHCGYRSDTEPGACAQCGTAISPDASLCPNCGSAVLETRLQEPRFAATEQQEVEYMGFWVRAAAWVIDFLFVAAAQVLVGLTGLTALSFLVGPVYSVLLVGLKGQTIGKMVFGIKVVDAQGNVPGIPRAFLREIVGKFFSAIAILLGYFWIGWDRRKRGWHDHIAGTFAVRNRRATA